MSDIEDLYKEAFILASGQYLTEHVPDNFDEMGDEDFENFIENHIWEGVENLPIKEVIQQIGQLADIIISFHRRH